MKKIFLPLLFLSSVLIAQAQNLGIGVNPPTQKLDVLGNVQFSGALMPNNLSGNVNDVLTSSGIANTPPTWSDASSGQMWNTVYSTDSITITYSNGGTYFLIPGLTQTVTVPATGTYDALLYTDGGVQWNNSVTGNLGIEIDILIYVDGSYQRVSELFLNTVYNFATPTRNWSFCYVVQNITAGSHTFQVKGDYRNIFSATANTITFGAKNLATNSRMASLSVCLIKK